MVGEGGSTEEGCRRRRRLDGEGFPVVEGGREGAGELCGTEAKLEVGSIWAERLWRRGSTAGLRLAGVRWSGGGVPGCLGRERARGRGEKIKESSLVLMRAREKRGGLCPGRATAASRWRPAGAHWARGAGWRLQREGSWVQKLVEVPREAEAKLELAGGDPERRAGGARHRRRERAERDRQGKVKRDPNTISKNSRDQSVN
jgi:hypothetical protein